jgi:hypothetical protein
MAEKSEMNRNALLILTCLRLFFLRVQFEDYVQSSDIAAMQSESTTSISLLSDSYD